ncbi:MAG: molecular chaperone DnaJ [Pseudomonas sp.]
MTNHAPKLSIAALPDKPLLSAGQKKFNTLLKDIEKQRKVIEAWKTTYSSNERRWHSDLKPLLDDLYRADFEMLCFLSEASTRVKLTKTDQHTLKGIIFSSIQSLMGGEYDDTLKAIYQKHAGKDFDTSEAQSRENFKQALEDEFGFTVDDDIDLDSIDDVIDHLSQKQREAADSQNKHKPHKKTKQEILHEQEQASATKSVRDIYRKLASALHPDREIEPTERERKTVLMQRVNQAYADNNLLGLLQLQLEIEQIDHSHISGLAEDQLKHYNRVLSVQLAELMMEATALGSRFKAQFHFEPFDNVTPANFKRKFPKVLRDLRDELEEQLDLMQELAEPKALKSWLREKGDMWDIDNFLAQEMREDFFR